MSFPFSIIHSFLILCNAIKRIIKIGINNKNALLQLLNNIMNPINDGAISIPKYPEAETIPKPTPKSSSDNPSTSIIYRLIDNAAVLIP